MSIDATTVSLNLDVVICDLDVMALPTPAERLEAACSAVAMQFLPLSGAGKTPFDVWVRDVRSRLLGILRSLFMQGAGSQGSNADIMAHKRPAARLTAACHGMLGDIDRDRAFRAKVLEDNPSFDLERWLAVLPHKEPWQTELYRKRLERVRF